jgi:hypothetical protein
MLSLLERFHFRRQLQRLFAQRGRWQRLELFDEWIDGLELAGSRRRGGLEPRKPGTAGEQPKELGDGRQHITDHPDRHEPHRYG